MKKRTLLCRNNPLLESAQRLIMYLRASSYTAWIVGGAPRDLLLGNEIKDIDIATDATPEALIQLFEHTHCVGAKFGVVVVIWEGISFEMATMRTESGTLDGRHPDHLNYTTEIEEDAKRRDFTINALYLDPISEEVFDFFTGFEDLKNKQLRTVGNPFERFKEDYLRMLRAVRFAARLSFVLDTTMQCAIIQLAHNISKLSVERLRNEITQCLLSGHPQFALESLLKLGILEHILPEVVALKNCTQDKVHHPEGDVFIHTCLALEAMNKKDEQLAWSILLHDICKPETRSIDDKGGIHFYLHECKGRIEAERILTRFKFDKNSINIISSSVGDHMRFFNVKNMKHSKLRHLFAMPHFLTTLELIRCDALGCHGDLEPYHMLCHLLEKFSSEPLVPAPLLNGKDLTAMGLTPGPLYKTLLSTLIDAQMEGNVFSREDAKNLIMSLIKKI